MDHHSCAISNQLPSSFRKPHSPPGSPHPAGPAYITSSQSPVTENLSMQSGAPGVHQAFVELDDKWHCLFVVVGTNGSSRVPQSWRVAAHQPQPVRKQVSSLYVQDQSQIGTWLDQLAQTG